MLASLTGVAIHAYSRMKLLTTSTERCWCSIAISALTEPWVPMPPHPAPPPVQLSSAVLWSGQTKAEALQTLADVKVRRMILE